MRLQPYRVSQKNFRHFVFRCTTYLLGSKEYSCVLHAVFRHRTDW